MKTLIGTAYMLLMIVASIAIMYVQFIIYNSTQCHYSIGCIIVYALWGYIFTTLLYKCNNNIAKYNIKHISYNRFKNEIRSVLYHDNLIDDDNFSKHIALSDCIVILSPYLLKHNISMYHIVTACIKYVKSCQFEEYVNYLYAHRNTK